MIHSASAFLRALERDAGVSPLLVALACAAAGVLLVLYVHTLNVSVERGQALRVQQQAALRTPAARVHAPQTDVDPGVRISSAQ